LRSERHIDDLIALLEKRLTGLTMENKSIEFDRWFNYLAFNVIGEVTFSKAFGFLETGTDDGGSIENSRILIFMRQSWDTPKPSIDWLWEIRWLESSAWLLLNTFDTVGRAVTDRKSNPNKRADMLEQWILQLREHPERFEENEPYGVANATVGAGADTISATLQAFWYYLLRSPQGLARTREEIDEAAAAGKLSPVVNYAESRDLPFLLACVSSPLSDIMSSLTCLLGKRNIPISPCSSPWLGSSRWEGRPEGWRSSFPRRGMLHKVKFDIGVEADFQKTHVSVNPWVIHWSKEFFGQDAQEFNPDG
jgi:hypothetical protein